MNEQDPNRRYDDEQVPGEVRDQLRSAASSVRPAGPVAPTVCSGVRRRRRRAFVAGLAGSAVVSLVVSVGVAVALPEEDRGATPADPSGETGDGEEVAFACPTQSRVFGEAPPIPDLEQQQQTVRTLKGLSSIQVRHAEPTALGVVALVVDDSGDPDSWADPEVADRLTQLGAALVYEWDPSAAGVGVDEHGQVTQVLQWQLEPAVRDVRSAVRGVAGEAGLALWQEAGAVLLQWKEPVPAEVEALAGVREDGVRVIVDGVRYSRADVRTAQARLQDWLKTTGRRDDWASAYGCADGSGLIVGMVPAAADAPGLAEQIEDAVGMPVLVVPEERPVSLVG